MDNEELYMRCMEKDESAWETVYNYVLAITRLPRWRLNDSPVDMAQSIVLFLIDKGIEEVRHPAAFRSFIRMVTCRKILDSFKKKNPVTTVYIPDKDYRNQIHHEVLHDCTTTGDSRMRISPDLIRIITTALDGLPSYCRELIPQYFKYKLGIIASFGELSATLEAPPGTVSSQITRCLRKLAQEPELINYYREN